VKAEKAMARKREPHKPAVDLQGILKEKGRKGISRPLLQGGGGEFRWIGKGALSKRKRARKKKEKN